jgi:hypothetical protein
LWNGKGIWEEGGRVLNKWKRVGIAVWRITIEGFIPTHHCSFFATCRHLIGTVHAHYIPMNTQLFLGHCRMFKQYLIIPSFVMNIRSTVQPSVPTPDNSKPPCCNMGRVHS